MKRVFLLGSTGILFLVAGCSSESQQAILQSEPTVVNAPEPVAAPAARATAPVPSTSTPSTPGVVEAAALPLPSAGPTKPPAWLLKNVKDDLGGAIELKQTSLDGKYDLVILERGRQPFVSFVRHDRWESVHNLPGQGNLMILRLKFEDGEEKHIEWDELGMSTENLNSVLWSYPAKKDAPLGPVAASLGGTVGGDQFLIQDMLQHTTMLLEVEPGVTTQFDLSDLAREMKKVRTPKTEPIIEARQSEE